MRPYEVVIIFDADLDEAATRAVVDRASEHVTGSGGEVSRVDRWGKRRFAYELDRRREGLYVVLQCRAEARAAQELDRILSLADEVLRHRIVRIPDHVYGREARARAGAEA